MLKHLIGLIDRIFRTVMFIVIGPVLFTVLLPYVMLLSGVELFRSGIVSSKYIGVVPIALGAAIILWCAWDLTGAFSGTPTIFDSADRLVTGRLYRIVRNPMYLAVGLILLGEAITFESLILLAYAVFLGLVCHLWVVYCEEPGLRNRFGAAYEEY